MVKGKMKSAKIMGVVALIALQAVIAGGCAFEKSNYVDGVYRAEDAEFSYGYKEFVEITIQDGKIASVVADAIKEDGRTLKSQDAEYRKNYEGTGNTTTPDVFYPSLSMQLEKKKRVDKVETVAGATRSSGNFKRLAAAALANAENGTQETAVVEAESTAMEEQ